MIGKIRNMQTESSTIVKRSIRSPLKPAKFYADELDRSSRKNSDRLGFQSAVACLDDASHGSTVFRHTKAIADGLQIPIKIIHVLQCANPQNGPSDPIQWQLQHREACDHLRHMLGEENEKLLTQDQILLSGLVDDELARWARQHSGNLMAITTRCDPTENHGHTYYHLGSAAQKLLDSSAASMLFVPPEAAEDEFVRYQRIAIPLDGSCRAESILPIAIRIARHHGAELVLVHVVPKPEIMESSTDDKEARELHKRVRQYNEQNVRRYLDSLKLRLHDESVSIKVVISSEGDPRDRLLAIANDHQADLIVMSARGRSELTDIPCGNIARHVATHSNIPLLMIRQQGSDFRNPDKSLRQNRGTGLFWKSAH